MAVSIVGLLILVVFLALAAGAVVLIVVGLVMRSRSSGVDGGTCGACGYAVRGLTSLSCPECGADLRQVGIRPAGGGKGGIAMLVSGVVLAGLLMMCVCSGVVLGFRASSVPAQPIVITPAQPTVQPAQPAVPQPTP